MKIRVKRNGFGQKYLRAQARRSRIARANPNRGYGTGAGNPSKYTPARVERVLAACREVPNVTRAAAEAGIGRSTLAGWRSKYPEFEEALVEALEQGVAKLEAEAVRRATKGYITRRHYDKLTGRVVMTERVKSDRLMELLLRAHDPKYRERVDHDVNVTWTSLVAQAKPRAIEAEVMDD